MTVTEVFIWGTFHLSPAEVNTVTDEDRFNNLESKIKQLETDKDRLESALTNLTEALMVLIEREEDMVAPDPTGPGFLANN